MNVETIAEQSVAKEPSVSTPFPKAWWGKLFYGLLVTVMPAWMFVSVEFMKPQWQTGKLSDYAILWLFPEASLLFFPLLVYSIVCYLLLLIAAGHYSSSLFIRFGIYTGLVLALQYSIALIIASAGIFVFGVVSIWIMSMFFLFAYRWAKAKWGMRTTNTGLVAIAITVYFVIVLIRHDLVMPLSLLLIALVIATPFLSLLLALRTSIWLFKNHETKLALSHGLGLTAWLAMYLAAFRFDILKMYELYARLPPSPPPDCYIATAAARGHSQVVGSWSVQLRDGSSMPVNVQLQRLKCAELALMAVSPRLHRVLRRIYDRVGKVIAHSIEHPCVADLAYLFLKPWEWLAGLVLKLIVPEIDSISRKMYTT